MTIAHIKSHALRRTLLVLIVPLLPLMILAAALKVAWLAFWDEMAGPIANSIASCWRGDDVRRK